MNNHTTQAEGVRASASPWSPLKIPLFRALWLATIASNIGTWMHDVGAGWLMTSLSPQPVMVALVQTATSLPVLLLALPAGALADIVDRRRFLIGTQLWLALVAALLAVATLLGMTTAWLLVALTFAMGLGTAMMMPAWAAITPEIVPRAELPGAIALNSMGMNVARAVGPAAAGVIVSAAGTGAVFALNAVSFLGVLAVLFFWRRQLAPAGLPAERFISALRVGFRFARHHGPLQHAMIRGAGFFLFASAPWALLPLIAKDLVGGGPQTFGIMVAAIGVGAVTGALVLPALRSRLSKDVLVAAATVLYAAATLVLATARELPALFVAMLVCGLAWIAVLSSLQVAAQLALPNWVRSRGLAVFMATFMGSMALGGLFWGGVAQQSSITTALLVAAGGGVLAVGLTWRWKIGMVDGTDFSPSLHWPAPLVHDGVMPDSGPVMVTIVYRVVPAKRREFLAALGELGRRRKRDGAFAWGVMENTEAAHEFIEYFMIESWLEHLRQHERVTNADRVLQDSLRTLLVPDSEPVVSHYVAPAEPRDFPPRRGIV